MHAIDLYLVAWGGRPPGLGFGSRKIVDPSHVEDMQYLDQHFWSVESLPSGKSGLHVH
jgi:hypothetical protein